MAVCPICKTWENHYRDALDKHSITFWQKQYMIMENEARKAAKGIKRLKKREQYLLECIKKNKEFYEKRMRDIMNKKGGLNG